MTEFDADTILDDYVARHPHARAAHLDDPLFVAQMDVLRRMLALLEPALYREGLDRPAVLRVVNTLVYGVPDPDAAIERMAEREEQIAKARWATPSLVIDGEMAASIAAFAAFLGGERKS